MRLKQILETGWKLLEVAKFKIFWKTSGKMRNLSLYLMNKEAYSERVQGPIYIINSDKWWIFDQSERAQGPIFVIKTNNQGHYRKISL